MRHTTHEIEHAHGDCVSSSRNVLKLFLVGVLLRHGGGLPRCAVGSQRRDNSTTRGEGTRSGWADCDSGTPFYSYRARDRYSVVVVVVVMWREPARRWSVKRAARGCSETVSPHSRRCASRQSGGRHKRAPSRCDVDCRPSAAARTTPGLTPRDEIPRAHYRIRSSITARSHVLDPPPSASSATLESTSRPLAPWRRDAPERRHRSGHKKEHMHTRTLAHCTHCCLHSYHLRDLSSDFYPPPVPLCPARS